MKQNNSITLISTVFNEEQSIVQFLKSIASQTLKPEEIIITDAKSSDKTRKLILDFKNSHPELNINVFIKKSNRSTGRNYAIKKSNGKIIAVSDAGCILEKNWLQKIVSKFQNKEIDVVSGFYKPIAKSDFQKCLSTYTCVMPDKLNDNFLPSSRSIAFRKEAWQAVKGYPEELNTCEDLVFAKSLKDRGCKFILEKKAIVKWPQKENAFQAFNQFFSYAVGDGRALYFRLGTPLLYIRYLLLAFLLAAPISIYIKTIILIILGGFYFLWIVKKNYKYVKKRSALIYLPILQLLSDIAVLTGTTFGIFQKIIN